MSYFCKIRNEFAVFEAVFASYSVFDVDCNQRNIRRFERIGKRDGISAAAERNAYFLARKRRIFKKLIQIHLNIVCHTAIIQQTGKNTTHYVTGIEIPSTQWEFVISLQNT